MKLDKNGLYYHGSSEAKVKRISPPSYKHPFYLTTDLHYAMAFCTKSMSSTGEYDVQKSYTPADSNFVYVVTLKPNCKIFDFRDRSSAEFADFYKILDRSLVEWVDQADTQSNDKDIYEFCASMITSLLDPVYDSGSNYLKYCQMYSGSSSEEDLMPPSLFLKACAFAKSSIVKEATVNRSVHRLMAVILKGLDKLGYHGIATIECDFNNEMPRYAKKVSTQLAIGIFDKTGLDMVSIVPMKYTWLKKINPKYLEDCTSSDANSKARRYVQIYNQLAEKR